MSESSESREIVVIACHAWGGEQVGGSFKVATEFAQYLASRGRNVCYVCGTHEREPQNPTRDRGVELWRYAYPAARSPHPGNLLGHVRSARRLTRQIARTGKIICVNGQTPLQFLGASLGAGRTCPRHVYTVHSPFDAELRSQWGEGRLSLARRLALQAARSIERVNLRRATRIHTASQFTLDELRRRYGGRVGSKGYVSPGWVDTDRFQPCGDRVEVRRRLRFSEPVETPTFLTVRRLERRMGLENLVDAARSLRQSGHRFRLLIGGTGSLMAELRDQVARNALGDFVAFLGYIPDGDLPAWFAAADCFVLPSSGLECFGLTILEAFACGVPVIATPTAAIPELVGLAGRDWLTDGIGADDLARKMSGFLTGQMPVNPGQLRQIAEQFRIESSASRLEALCLNATSPSL